MHRPLLLASAASVALLSAISPTLAQESTETVTVTAEKLAAARNGIQTQTGASTYTITAKDIQAQPGGDNAQLNSVILQMPGVAQDSFGQLHVRGEHNGLQYRLNGIILPEGISVFGQTLDPRLAESVRLITGALPAEYGNRTAGIIDIQTKSGVFDNGGVVSMYGGSHSTLSPSIAYGGSSGHFNYFVSGDYTTNTLGIESPDGSSDPRHDRTQQYHGFAVPAGHPGPEQQRHRRAGHLQRHLPDSQPGRAAAHGAGRHCRPGAAGSRQRRFRAEGQWRDGFPVRKSGRAPARDHPLRHSQLSAFGGIAGLSRSRPLGAIPACSSRRATMSATFSITALAQTAYKRDVAYGLQAEGAWHACTSHTIRFGVLYQADDTLSKTSSLVLPTDNGGPGNPNPNPLCTDPDADLPDLGHAADHCRQWQQAWLQLRLLCPGRMEDRRNVTINYGLRYDAFQAFDAENQISPRVNAVWTADRYHHHPCRLCALLLAAAL